MTEALQLAEWMIAPVIITLADSLLPLYLCREALNRGRSTLINIGLMMVLLVMGTALQFALNGSDGQQGSIYLWLISKYLMICLTLRLFTTLKSRAIFFYATVYLIISDLCLILVVRVSFMLFGGDMLTVWGAIWQRIIMHAVLIAVKLAALLIAERFMPPRVYGLDSIRKALFVIVPVIPYIFMRDFPNWLNLLPSQITNSVRLMTILTGVCALIVLIGNERVAHQAIQAEVQRLEYVIQRRHEQLIARSTAVDEINRRYHDLKYLLQGIEVLQKSDEIKEYARLLHAELQDYECNFETGNEAFNVVLSDKARLCAEKGIRLVPIINVQGWEQVATIDITTIFGNALDNAIESAMQIEEGDRRRVTVRVGKVNTMLVARIENFFVHELVGSLDDLATTKKTIASHGFGLKSIRTVTERLGGDLNVSAENGRFVLTVLIPCLA